MALFHQAANGLVRETGFDTILLLMNGTGIGGTLNGLEQLLRQLRNMLCTGGQILIDSSDIRYLFEEDDGSVWVENVTGVLKFVS